MLEKYDISLKNQIESHVANLNYKDHNLSFTNMFLWKDMFKLNVYISDEFIIVFSNLDGELFSLNPICVIENISDAVEFLLKYFKDNNLPFIMHNCVPQVKNEIEKKYKDFFTYELSRDSFDYLYTVEKILSYSGKKLQKKRNHLNNFIKNYGDAYEIVDLNNNVEVRQDCIDFTIEWDKNKLDRDIYIDQEVSGTIDVLKHFDELSAHGIAVYIDGKLEGFSLGTILNDTTAVLNVEKANAKIPGLYAFIRRELVKKYFSNLIYINTEDDAGDENLRKSKLSYQPEYLVEKYTIKRKDEN